MKGELAPTQILESGLAQRFRVCVGPFWRAGLPRRALRSADLEKPRSRRSPLRGRCGAERITRH